MNIINTTNRNYNLDLNINVLTDYTKENLRALKMKIRILFSYASFGGRSGV